MEVKAKENQKLKTDLEEARAKLEEALGNADEKEQLNNEIASMRASGIFLLHLLFERFLQYLIVIIVNK